MKPFGTYVREARAILDRYTTGGGPRCKRWHLRGPADGVRLLLLNYVARAANKVAAHRAVLKSVEGDRSVGAGQLRDLHSMELREAAEVFRRARADVETRLGSDPLSLLACDEDAAPEPIRTAALSGPRADRHTRLVKYQP